MRLLHRGLRVTWRVGGPYEHSRRRRNPVVLGAQDPSPTVWRSSGHGPYRRTVPNAARRNRFHQIEPARPGHRAARQRPPPQPNALRPAPPALGRPDPTDGIHIAVAYTKIYNRLLVPLTADDQPLTPSDLRHADLYDSDLDRVADALDGLGG